MDARDPRRDSKISLNSISVVGSGSGGGEGLDPPGSGAITPLSLDERRVKEYNLAEYTAGRFGDDLYNDDTSENRKLLWKQDLRIVPLSAFIYLLCYLDRSNVGNALILNSETGNDLGTELNIDEDDFAISLMVFLISLALFEVPSNIYLKQLTPSRWIAFLMFCWGAVTVGTSGCQSFASLTVTRFLLGLFEAGLFPGLVYYLTFWYRVNERSMRVAIIIASATLAGAFGGAIAFGISHMNMVHGLSSWRWVMILEGIPSCLAAIAVWYFLPDFPETSSWLSPEEKELAAARLAFNGSKGTSAGVTWTEVVVTLKDWRLYVHYVIYFAMSVSFSSLSLFTPSITNGLGYSSVEAQLMTVPPWACAYILTLLVAWTSDRYNARASHSAASMLVAAIGFLISAALPPGRYIGRYICLIVACSGTFASLPPLLGWLTGNLHSTSAAALAIALNVSWGAPGQIVGVWIYQKEEQDDGYPTGHWVNVAMMLLGAFGCIGLRWWYKQDNERIRKEGGQEKLWKL